MRIYPAPHYTMGGLWVDYNLMSDRPRVVRDRRGEFLRPRREPARRERADAGPGGRILHFPLHDRRLPRAGSRVESIDRAMPAFVRRSGRSSERAQAASRRQGQSQRPTVPPATRASHVGQLRHVPHRATGLERGDRAGRDVAASEFWQDVYVGGTGEDFNQSLEHAGRVADFMEFAELMCHDALQREESCGGHFREEYQTPDGEARRDDADVLPTWPPGSSPAWASPPQLHKEPLAFEYVHPCRRGATSSAPHAARLASTPDRSHRRVRRPTRCRTRRPHMSFLEMLDLVNEQL